MVEYNCLRCGYVAKQKNHLVNHLKRKNICKPILEDISIETIKKMYGFEINEKSLQNSSKFLQNSSEIPPNDLLQKSSTIFFPNPSILNASFETKCFNFSIDIFSQSNP